MKKPKHGAITLLRMMVEWYEACGDDEKYVAWWGKWGPNRSMNDIVIEAREFLNRHERSKNKSKEG